MAISVLFNGVVYSVPETGEESWGESLTSYLTAIASGCLQKTGGAFTLTADVNFGSNFGLLSKYFSTRTALPSTAGLVRLAVSDSIGWRNNANGGNLLLAVNGSDQLTFNGTAIYPAGITALTGDVTATGPGSVAATIAANAVSSAKFRQSVALSVVGNATNATANVTDIIAGTDNFVLRRSGTALGFALLLNVNIDPSAAIAVSKLAALTASRAVVTDSSGFIAAATTTSTEIGYVNGVTSAIQTQLDAKLTATLASANIFVGNVSNVATAVAPTGDVTISNTGVTAIGANKVTNAMLQTAASAATALYVTLRDANANILANNYLTGYTTTATAAATTTLLVGSTGLQYFTGSTTQTVALPVTSTLVLGQSFTIVNNSSGVVTVNSSGGDAVQAMAASSIATVTCILTSGTSAASWSVAYSTASAGGGSVTSVAMTVPTALFATSPVSGSPITTAGTLAPALATQTARTFFQGPQGGSAATPTFAALAVPTQQIFTSGTAQTYTTPTSPAPLYIKVTVVGGGGGGGDSDTDPGGGSGGGGGGGAAIKWISSPSATYTYTVGAAGAHAAAGGTTSFGSSLCAASGGDAGATASTSGVGFGGGSGGIGTFGDILIAGSAGGTGSSSRPGVAFGSGGAGGMAASAYGGGGGKGSQNGAGNAGQNYGGGGAGSCGGTTNGAVGVSGLIVVEEFYQ